MRKDNVTCLNELCTYNAKEKHISSIFSTLPFVFLLMLSIFTMIWVSFPQAFHADEKVMKFQEFSKTHPMFQDEIIVSGDIVIPAEINAEYAVNMPKSIPGIVYVCEDYVDLTAEVNIPDVIIPDRPNYEATTSYDGVVYVYGDINVSGNISY